MVNLTTAPLKKPLLQTAVVLIPHCFKTLHYVGNEFHKCSEKRHRKTLFPKRSFVNHKTNQVENFTKITGFQTQAGKGLQQQTMIDLLEVVIQKRDKLMGYRWD